MFGVRLALRNCFRVATRSPPRCSPPRYSPPRSSPPRSSPAARRRLQSRAQVKARLVESPPAFVSNWLASECEHKHSKTRQMKPENRRQNIFSYVSYSEIEIQCRGEDNTNYNVLRDLQKIDTNLVGVFNDASGQNSAICIFSIRRLFCRCASNRRCLFLQPKFGSHFGIAWTAVGKFFSSNITFIDYFSDT